MVNLSGIAFVACLMVLSSCGGDGLGPKPPAQDTAGTVEVEGVQQQDASADTSGRAAADVAAGDDVASDGGGDLASPPDATADSSDAVALCDTLTLTACDDGNACTTDSCAPGVSGSDAAGCVHTKLPDDTTCTPSAASCHAGACKAGVCTEGALLPAGSTCGDDIGKCGRRQCNAVGVCETSLLASLCPPTKPCYAVSCTGAGACDATFSTAETPCEGDGVTCTIEACNGQGTCVPAATDVTICDDGTSCTNDSCDPKAGGADAKTGCVHTSQDAACDDGNPCTTDACTPGTGEAGSGCSHTSLPDASACTDDDLKCTDDACAGGVCQHALVGGACLIEGVCVIEDATKADNVCAACRPTKDTAGWTLLDGEACSSDGLTCTLDQCKSGSCEHVLASDACLIDGACHANLAPSPSGCAWCDATTKSDTWTPYPAATPCPDDGFGCTIDSCDGKGTCGHAPKHVKCNDGLDCTKNVCDPPNATTPKGCAFIDSCPYGHSCDTASGTCVTPEPLLLATSDANNPSPTNPTVIRHVLDASTGTSRWWVFYQSQSCMASPVVDTWKVTSAATLRGVVFDSQVAAPADKVKAPALTMPTSSGSGAVCQAHPVVMADAIVPGQAWLSWLEAGVAGTPAGPCALKNDAVGGITRLALLDGSTIQDGAAWSKAAGSTCTTPVAGAGALFETRGFAMLDVSGDGAFDVSSRPMLDLLFGGADFTKAPSVVRIRKGPVNEPASIDNPAPAKVLPVHPVLVDMLSGTNRYVAFLLYEDTNGSTVTRTLSAAALDNTGTTTLAVPAMMGTTPGAGPDYTLDNVTEVCSLDATLDPKTGVIGLAMVVRRKLGDGQQGALIFGALDPAVTWGPKLRLVANDVYATGDCRFGLSAARVGIDSNGIWTIVAARPSSAGGTFLPHMYRLFDYDQVKSTTLDAIPQQWSTDTDATVNVPPLDWRGIGDVVGNPDGGITVAIEAKISGAHAVLLYTFRPPGMEF